MTEKLVFTCSPERVFADRMARPGLAFSGTRSLALNARLRLASRVASFRILPSCRKWISTSRAGLVLLQPEEKLWPRRRNVAPAAALAGIASMDGEGQGATASRPPAEGAPASSCEAAPGSCL